VKEHTDMHLRMMARISALIRVVLVASALSHACACVGLLSAAGFVPNSV